MKTIQPFQHQERGNEKTNEISLISMYCQNILYKKNNFSLTFLWRTCFLTDNLLQIQNTLFINPNLFCLLWFCLFQGIWEHLLFPGSKCMCLGPHQHKYYSFCVYCFQRGRHLREWSGGQSQSTALSLGTRNLNVLNLAFQLRDYLRIMGNSVESMFANCGLLYCYF